MKTTFRSLLAAPLLLTALITCDALASSADVVLDRANINLNDQASLQRGARNFVTYCLNCHSAQYMRYGHLTQIGLTEDQIKANLMFTTDKIADYMVSGLDPNDAKDWLRSVPPDLTLIARVRGEDWLYTFLRSFYQDAASSTGWGNTVFKSGIAMPHVLHDLQGSQALVKVGEKSSHGKMVPVMKLQVERKGSMSATEYDGFVRDLVNYLTFMGEPAKAQRTQLGVMVMFFLVIAFFATLWLKHEYWKDVR